MENIKFQGLHISHHIRFADCNSMSNDASRISVNSSEEAHSSNSASAASETAASAATAGTSGGHHFLRKRHSPGSGKKLL